MAKLGLVARQKFGIALVVVGVVMLMLGLLDYLQDGKNEGWIGGAMAVVAGFFLYISRGKAKAQDE